MNPETRIARALEEQATPFASAAELEALARVHGDLRDGDRWGAWIYRAGPGVLDFQRDPPRGARFEVDLAQAMTPATVLDWLFRLSGKPWATDADVGALVRALRTVTGRDRGEGVGR